MSQAESMFEFERFVPGLDDTQVIPLLPRMTAAQQALEFLYRLEKGEVAIQTVPTGAEVFWSYLQYVIEEGSHALLQGVVVYEMEGRVRAVRLDEVIPITI